MGTSESNGKIGVGEVSRSWSYDEDDKIKREYFFNGSEGIASSLGRNAGDVDSRAKELGIVRLEKGREYTVSQVLKSSGISFSTLQEAIFAEKELVTRIYNPDSRLDFYDVPRGAVLINGESLISFFNKDPASRERVKTRAVRYMEGSGSEGFKGYDKDLFHPMRLLTNHTQKYPLLSEEEEEKAVTVQGHLERNDLVEGNIRGAISFAKKRENKMKGKQELEDGVQDAILGLIDASQEYDKDRHLKSGDRDERYKFNTLSHHHMRKSFYRQLAKTSETIRVPKNGACGNNANRSSKKIKVVSLDKEVSEGTALKDFLEDKSPDLVKEYKVEESRREILESLSKLTDKDREVINKIYGLNGYEETGLKEVGSDLSRSKEMARQIEKRAIRSLRYHPNIRKLAEEVFGIDWSEWMKVNSGE